MKFTISSKALQSLLASAIKVVPQRPTLQILGSVLIHADNDNITVRASDTEMTLAVSTKAASVEEPGAVCVDAKFLTYLVKNIPDVPVTLFSTDKEVKIITPSGNYATGYQPANTYPVMEDAGEIKANLKLPAEVFLKGMRKVSFACSTDNFRQQLMGVCVDCRDNMLRMYATDTFKLARYCVHADVTECRFIIPNRATPIIGNLDGDIEIDLYERNADFRAEGFFLRSQLIVGNFPDCERIFPHEFKTDVTINKTSLISAIRRAGVCFETDTEPVKLNFADNSVQISATNISSLRSAAETIPCSIVGDGIKTAFTSNNVVSILSTLDGEDVCMFLSASDRPCVFQGADDTRGELTILQMPMRVD